MTSGEFTEVQYDSREKDEELIELLEFEHQHFMERVTLPVFDYIQGDAGIERKTIADFIGSYKSKKNTNIWSQCGRMVAQTEWSPYLIVVGTTHSEYEDDLNDIDRYYLDAHKREATEADYNSFWGAVSSIMVRYHIPVIIVPTREVFARMVTKIFHSHRHGKAMKAREVNISPTAKYSAVERILSLVPGISTKARDIVEHLNLTLPRDIWSLTYEDLKNEVPGIGPKKAEAIIDYLGI